MRIYHKKTQGKKNKEIQKVKNHDTRPSKEAEQAFRELAQKFSKANLIAVDTYLSVLRLSTEVNLRQESFYGKFNLSPGRFQILLLLRTAREFALSPSDLAEKTGVSRATMTQFIDSLEKAGHVRRKAFPGDRRASLIALSPEGLALLDKKLLPKYFKRCALIGGSATQLEMKSFLTVYQKFAASLAQFEEE